MTSSAYESLLVSDLPSAPHAAPTGCRALISARLSDRRERRADERAMAFAGPTEWARMQSDLVTR